MAGSYHHGEWFDVDDTVQVLVSTVERLEKAQYSGDSDAYYNAICQAIADVL